MRADILYFPAREVDEDEPVTRSDAQRIMVSYPPEPSSAQVLRLIEASGTLSFWDSPAEDIYTPEDGEPV